ncbi:MAG: CRISPR-associated helicase Cas3' [Acidobacteriia bacterium]|nr:CRISPR-associated helicase Cas3' [Terriglobia bacterium]
MRPDLIGVWPGKLVDGQVHPALWHLLDVGAVASRLISREPLTSSIPGNQAAAFLVALHDLGKFSCTFRSMLLGQPYRGLRHWQHSYRLLRDHDDMIADVIGGTPEVRRILYAAVAGHHGGPPAHLESKKYRDQAKQIGAAASEASKEAISAISTLFPTASLNNMCESEARRISWALCGLTVEADWIGSNADWFGPEDPRVPVEDYWQRACKRAETPISVAGLHQARPRRDGFARVLPRTAKPRPMQAAAAEIALPVGSALVLLEDATGAGKTEAALILAARMMASGKADGLFFALPTMATSNAMLERLESIAPRLFEGSPSLALTHGRARMNDLFRKIRGRDASDPGGGISCGSWLADDRRRVLLADVGVGTIDQALLAVLPTRFNTLRLRALSKHVLIVDEAHEFDPYMEAQLQGLLRFQAMLGGSAIVMTATLPLGMRNGYAKAFQRGLGIRRPRELRTDAYPTLSVIGRSIDCLKIDPVPATRRDIDVLRIESTDEAIARLKHGVRSGAACAWIRNSVDGAIEAFLALKDLGMHADLLHARFSVMDRLEREAALQARFGRDGTGRAGRILVATQVVEASLDLDFDLMVSDLAPVGSLIQRAGRLWRHMDLRPAGERPIPGPALHVLSPDPDRVDDSSWLKRILGPGAMVYPQDTQWRTARALFDSGVIRAPDGIRELIEAVHGGGLLEVPDALKEAEVETIGRRMSEAQQAFNQVLDAEDEYDQIQMQRVFSDDRFPTRLGLPQVTLRLAREESGKLTPWGGEGPLGWQSSEVRVSAARYSKLSGVDQDRDEIVALRESWPSWMADSAIVAPVREGSGMICEGMRYDSALGVVFAG